MQAKYLASIILAVLAISIGVLMYTLTTNVIQEFAKLLTPSQLNQMKLDVTIKSVYFLSLSNGTKYVWLSVYNRGPLKVIIKKITVINSTDAFEPYRVEPANLTINSGDSLTLRLYFNWTPQEYYRIILSIRAEGQSISDEVKWEGTATA